MGWISLHEMRFISPVGVTEEEREKKNDILVDLSVQLDTKMASSTDEIGNTVDYEVLYQAVEEIVNSGSHLIEYLAAAIGEKVLADHSRVNEVKVVVNKLAPPIRGNCSRASVKMRFKR